MRNIEIAENYICHRDTETQRSHRELHNNGSDDFFNCATAVGCLLKSSCSINENLLLRRSLCIFCVSVFLWQKVVLGNLSTSGI